MKKLLIISISVIILLGLGCAGYYFFYYKPAPAIQTVSNTTTSYKLTKISDDQVISPTVSEDGSAVWYFNSKGQLFRRTLVGDNFVEFPFPQAISNFNRAFWPPSGTDLIMGIFTNSTNSYVYYDSTARQLKNLPANIQNLDWMPDGRRIVYVWKSNDGKSQQLFLANSDTSGFRKISDLFWPDMQVKVSPDGNSALLYRGNTQDPNKIYKANLQTGQIITLVDAGKNMQAAWVTSTKFIYFQIVNNSPLLYLFDLTSNQTQSLGISSAADKVVADRQGKYVYAVVSETDNDSLVKIDLNTLQRETIYKFDVNIRAHNLFMNDQSVMFINSLDGKLYSLAP